MEYKIENDLIVTVKDKEKLGTWLAFLYDDKTYTEHLWQHNKNFEIIHHTFIMGRSKWCKMNGNHFNMEKHGFARKSSFDFVEKTHAIH